MFEARACLDHLGLLFNRLEKSIDLLVRGRFHQCTLALAEFLRKVFETNIFIDSLDCWTHYLGVQFPDQTLKFRLNFTFTMIYSHRDARHLSMCFNALLKPGKGCSK